ncbi:NAD(P)/FAD-dependent oxidoreductase [Lysinibacillus sp. Bpr_S20]|uniref:NAD(P)/FAD-dependent oxidoreductase n=1 Tax=Lysinibacillus sp. Bpr_S20 TaxID=2933964 RepID=UPI002011A418|nr:NAD(P)/FAD-dependent oxidoreductase [Lysinibacillus sp. Bpr_S20]MCL1699448.1 NAD(P)/FAD-dependent oxidoreductase [Lysinibacillus sp. Bpr_S20]
MKIFDCAIIGGGPAGLNAALLLGRANRIVALFDTNNDHLAFELQESISRNGNAAIEFMQVAKEKLNQYPTIHSIVSQSVRAIKQSDNKLFKIYTEDGESFLAEKILLTDGTKIQTDIPNIQQYYNKSIFTSPYGYGWELKDKKLIYINETGDVARTAKIIYNLSNNLVVATNGHEIKENEKKELENKGINVITNKIKEMKGSNGTLNSVIFEDGLEIEREAGFITPSIYTTNTIGQGFSCDLDEQGLIIVDHFGRTSEKNVYAAGDAAQPAPTEIVLSEATGIQVAITINSDLSIEKF